MNTSTPQVRRLIIGSGVTMGFCAGGWLALGLGSAATVNSNIHRFWGLLLLAITIMTAMTHATGWLLRAVTRRAVRDDGTDAIYAAGYAAGVSAQPGGEVVELHRTPLRTH